MIIFLVQLSFFLAREFFFSRSKKKTLGARRKFLVTRKKIGHFIKATFFWHQKSFLWELKWAGCLVPLHSALK